MTKHHPAITLMVAFGMAFLFATAYVIVFTWSLPPTDGAYGSPPFADPLVLPIMSMIACVSAVATWPFVHFALRDRRLPVALLVAGGITLVEIVVVTPVESRAGFLLSYPTYGSSQ